jgi:UDP-2,4-diacetamido-2,4,6-trideoxy-beta-L-altropyranose hydrolase
LASGAHFDQQQQRVMSLTTDAVGGINGPHTAMGGEQTMVFRVDASMSVGMGHLSRCLTLAGYLQRAGGKVLFICGNKAADMSGLIRKGGFEVLFETSEPTCHGDAAHPGETGEGWRADADAFMALMSGRGRADWVIVDHYGLDARWEQAIRPVARRVMVIDDLANRSHACDLLLDQTYGETGARYDGLLPPHCTLLTGTAYALLKPEFESTRSRSGARSNTRAPSVVHVFFGSADVQANTLRFTGLLLRHFASLCVKVAVGPGSSQVSGLAELAAEYGSRLSWETGTTNMAEHMSGCDVAIGAPGMATWERACLGIPGAYIAVAGNQIPILQNLVARGFCAFIGADRDLADGEFIESVESFLGNAAGLLAMRELGMAAVDGLGAKRVASALTAVRCH